MMASLAEHAAVLARAATRDDTGVRLREIVDADREVNALVLARKKLGKRFPPLPAEAFEAKFESELFRADDANKRFLAIQDPEKGFAALGLFLLELRDFARELRAEIATANVRVLFTSSGVAGAMTSVRHFTPQASRSSLQRDWRFAFETRTGAVEVIAAVTHKRSLEGFPRVGASDEARIAQEFEFLRTTDAIVFVLDSQREVSSRNQLALEATIRDLIDLGRNPNDVQMVFFANKRDLPNVLAIDSLVESLSVRNPEVIETIATEGKGLDEGLKRLIGRVQSSRLDAR